MCIEKRSIDGGNRCPWCEGRAPKFERCRSGNDFFKDKRFFWRNERLRFKRYTIFFDRFLGKKEIEIKTKV